MKRPKRRSAWGWLPVFETRLGPQHAVMIAGSGRSGTTWLAQLINHDYSYRYYHEPFGPAVYPALRPVLYLRTDNREARYVEPVDQTLRGSSVWNWTKSNEYNRSIQPYNRLVFHRRLIKECRANLWLHWLRARYPELPLIFIMRHPIAVAYSTIHRRLPNVFTEYFTQRELMEDHLAPFYDRLEVAKSGPEWDQHVFNWCIQNYVPLRELPPRKTHLMFYEQLLLHPQSELERLFAFLGKDVKKTTTTAFARPSSTTRWNSAIRTGSGMIGAWKKNVTESDQKRALDIVGLFGLDAVYSSDILPNVTAANALLASNAENDRSRLTPADSANVSEPCGQ